MPDRSFTQEAVPPEAPSSSREPLKGRGIATVGMSEVVEEDPFVTFTEWASKLDEAAYKDV